MHEENELMLQDLLLISELSEAVCIEVSYALGKAEFGKSGSLVDVVANVGVTLDSAEAILRLVTHVTTEELPKFWNSMSLFAANAGFPNEQQIDLNPLKANLDILVQDYPCIRTVRKASRLLRDIGNEFSSAKFIGDIRPVLDDNRTSVLGHVVITTMSVSYIAPNSDTKVLEIVFTDSELQTFRSLLDTAISKSNVLRNVTIVKKKHDQDPEN